MNRSVHKIRTYFRIRTDETCRRTRLVFPRVAQSLPSIFTQTRPASCHLDHSRDIRSSCDSPSLIARFATAIPTAVASSSASCQWYVRIPDVRSDFCADAIGCSKKLKETANDKGTEEFAELKGAVWHECLHVILAEIRRIAMVGEEVLCGDDIVRCFYLVLLILSADYEEQSVPCA